MALVGAGAAFDAGVEEDPERPILAAQFGHLLDGLILPVLHQLPGKTERLLKLGSCDVRLTGSHAARDKIGNLKRVGKLALASVRCLHLLHGMPPALSGRLRTAGFEFARPIRQVTPLARIVDLVAGGTEKQPGACSSLEKGKTIISAATKPKCTSSTGSAGIGCQSKIHQPEEERFEGDDVGMDDVISSAGRTPRCRRAAPASDGPTGR